MRTVARRASQALLRSRCLLGDWALHSSSHSSRDAQAGGAAAAADGLPSCQQAEPPKKMEHKPLAPPGFSRTFYKRQLPSPPAIEFASDRGAPLRRAARPLSCILRSVFA